MQRNDAGDAEEVEDMQKYHIEKNTVQETLIIPLYGRKVCSDGLSGDRCVLRNKGSDDCLS